MYGTYAKPLDLVPLTYPHLDNLSSLTALIKALDDLENLCDTVEDAYQQSLANDHYERWVEQS